MKKKIIAVVGVIVLIALMVLCYLHFKPKPEKKDTSSSSAAETVSEAESTAESTAETEPAQDQTGSKSVTLNVVNKAGETKAYTVKTDADYLKGLMDEIAEDGDFTFAGSDGDYGFFIDTVNGETADYSVDGSYWAIYVNDEYGMYGADQQVVADGDTYTLKYESAGETAETSGEGSKSVTVEVIDKDGETTAYTAKTDADYLKGLMDELAEDQDFTFEGSDGDYGFFITAVNGETAEYEKDNAYWAIYVNGDYGMYGADQQVVADGDTYTFKYEPAA